jgi:hypothetical protein
MKNHLLVARVLLSCAAHSQNLAAVLDMAAECPALGQCPSVSARWRAEEAGVGLALPGPLGSDGPEWKIVGNGPRLRRTGNREILALHKK